MLASTIERTMPPAEAAREIAARPLSHGISRLLEHDDLDALLASDARVFRAIMERLARALQRAFSQGCDKALFETHKSLFCLYEESVKPPRPGGGRNQYHPFVIRLRNEIEQAWERAELRRIRVDPGEIPTDEAGFVSFLKERCFSHRLACHPLFDYLEREATFEDMASFFRHEGTLILRFCDLIVLSLLGVQDDVRRELAENFWDEVGNGNYQNRHTELYRRLLRYLGIKIPDGNDTWQGFTDELGWQGLAGYNLYLYLALHRANYFKSMGGMGVAELMDPQQYRKIVRGCRRLGLTDDAALAYYVDHIEIDQAHGDGWLTNVMVPLIRRYPEARSDMVVGALMRLNTTADYYDALHRDLSDRQASQPKHRTARRFCALTTTTE